MTSDKESPLLGIRMKPIAPFDSERGGEFEDACESIAIARSQELDYMCRDYLTRRKQRKGKDMRHDSSMIDPSCREKMCEWCYRVCDCGQFPCTREMVAVAFSYLDRFLDRCSCDRASFKLAAVTAFYIATKILSPSQISIRSLVELSRGEFDAYHVQDMERLILSTLEWRMNPPSAQSIIHHLVVLLPSTTDAAYSEELVQRAIFFAELSVYDYSFVNKTRFMIAVACVLNAVEVLEDYHELQGYESFLLATLEMSGVGVDLDHHLLERAQARLWYLYSCSAQVPEDDNIKPLLYSSRHTVKFRSTKPKRTDLGHSPVSVNINTS